MIYKYRFSIFTATYNRCNQLRQLYDCIKKLTYSRDDFEWVVVSDGSTDDTDAVVKNFIQEGIININYITKPNGGKHTAWRTVTKVFQGKYVVTADDDDPISPDYLSVFDKQWTLLENSKEYERFWEVRARSQYEDGSLVGEKLPEPYFDSDYIEVNYKLKKGAEMVGCRKLEILRTKAAVPDSFYFEDKCTNFAECLRWAKAARIYKTRFIPDVIRTYIVGHEGLSSKDKSVGAKTYNGLVQSLYMINEFRDVLLIEGFRSYLFTLLHLAYSSIKTRESLLKLLNNRIDRILYLLLYIPAFMIFLVRH